MRVADRPGKVCDARLDSAPESEVCDSGLEHDGRRSLARAHDLHAVAADVDELLGPNVPGGCKCSKQSGDDSSGLERIHAPCSCAWQIQIQQSFPMAGVRPNAQVQLKASQIKARSKA